MKGFKRMCKSRTKAIANQSDYMSDHPHFLAETNKSLDVVVGHILSKYSTIWLLLTALPSTCFRRSFLVACDEELKKFTSFRHALSVPSDIGRSEKAFFVTNCNKWSMHPNHLVWHLPLNFFEQIDDLLLS